MNEFIVFIKSNSKSRVIPDGFVFFRTEVTESNNGIKGQLELIKSGVNIRVNFENMEDYIIFDINKDSTSKYLWIEGFLISNISFNELGLGHSVFSFIKSTATRLGYYIKLKYADQNSMNFYLKEGFKFDSSGAMIWSPNINYQPPNTRQLP